MNAASSGPAFGPANRRGSRQDSDPGRHVPGGALRPRLAVVICLLAAAAPSLGVVIPAPQRILAHVSGTVAAPIGNEMDMPTDVAVDSAGRIYVADGVKRRVVAFRPDGAFVGAIDLVGDVRLLRPVGLCVDGQDRLWIADPGLHRVLAVAAKPQGWPGRAQLLVDLDLPSVRRGEALEPADPTDVAVSFDGRRIYVVDDANHRLIACDAGTRAVQIIGGMGRGLGDFEYPFSIAVAPSGYILVCEAIGARVQRITPAGRPSGQIGRWGIEVGQFYRPKGIAVSPAGLVYVGDSSLGVVQAFRVDGTFLGVLTDPQGQPLHLQHPMGMALDPQGRLLVVELGANRVSIVTVGGSAAASPLPTTQPVPRRAAP
jgi:DNA-binding beta-propeller fold protein YncE